MSSLGRRGNKILQGMTEAVSVAKGEQPAARITWQGHAYVPLVEYERLRAALECIVVSVNNSAFCGGVLDTIKAKAEAALKSE